MTISYLIADARAALGDAAFAAAKEAGRTLRLDQVIAEAFDDPGPREASGGRIVRLPARLTRSETEVLRLIATGKSNREIADQLARSVRTVERHITNLYAKIDARGKADATAYALRHGMIAQ